MSNNITLGARVRYTTTGRYPKIITGTVTGFDGGWVVVKDDEGVSRKTRPSPITLI
jgi:hypothetical protein